MDKGLLVILGVVGVAGYFAIKDSDPCNYEEAPLKGEPGYAKFKKLEKKCKAEGKR